MCLVLVIFLLLPSPVQAFAQANGSASRPAAETPALTTRRRRIAGAERPWRSLRRPRRRRAAVVSPSILPKDLSVWGMFMQPPTGWCRR